MSKKVSWGRKLAKTFVKPNTHRMIHIRNSDGKSYHRLFIAVDKKGKVSVLHDDEKWTVLMDKYECKK